MQNRSELTIGSTTLHVEHVIGRVAVGELFRFRAQAISSDVTIADLLGKPFVLKIYSLLEEELCVHGIVAAVERSYAGAVHSVVLDLGPDVEMLTLGQDSFVYQDLTAVEIVKDVLASAGIASSAVSWATKGTYAKRAYTVQQRESDWSFVERILAEEGIYYFFEQKADATKLVFADDSTNADAVSGAIAYRMHHGVTTRERWIAKMGAQASITHDAVALRDRDADKPDLALDQTAKVGAGKLELYEWPGRFLVPADGTKRSKLWLEALRARRHAVSGESGTFAICAGSRFSVSDHPSASCNGSFFCTEVRFDIGGPSGGARIVFSAIPAATPFRLSWRATSLAPRGPEPAIVVGASGQEIDADKTARVVVQPPWDRAGKKDEKASMRVRSMQAPLTGSMANPRIGWEMLVAHHDGDSDRPWTMGRMIDGAHPTPYALPGDMTRTAWQTPTSPSDGTSSEIRFEDKAGAEEIFVNAARDMNVTIGDNEAWTIGNDHTLDVGGNRSTKVGADTKLTVGGDQDTSVTGSEALTVDGSRSVTVKGKETVIIGGAHTLDVTSDRSVDVAGDRKLDVGGALKSSTKAGLTREILKAHTAEAGGAWTTQSDQGLTHYVAGNTDESIVGAKTQTGKTGVSTLVKGNWTETIAGAFVVASQGNIGESAKGKVKMTLAGALVANATSIEIEGKSEISIVCGGTSISIKSDTVEVKSAMLSAAGPTITHSGSTVSHNS